MDDDTIQTSGPFSVAAFTQDFKLLPAYDQATTALETLKPLDEQQVEWLEIPESYENDTLDFQEPSELWTEQEIPSPVASIRSATEDSVAEDGVWNFSPDEIPSSEPAPFRSWEQVADPAFEEPCRYLSNASFGAYDIILRECDPAERDKRPVKPDIFMSSLLQLGLGRDSLLFTFNKDGTHAWRLDTLRASGLSTTTTESLVDTFAQCGLLFRRMRKLGAYVYRKATFPPATVAFAQLTGDILLELGAHVTSRQPSRSIVQLQEAFKLPFKVLTLLNDVFKGLRSLRTDQDVLSFVYEIAVEIERSEVCLVPLMQEVLAHTSRSWLDSVSACVGLIERDAASDRLRDRLEREIDWAGTLDDEDTFDAMFPTFFSLEDRALVMQTFQATKVLENQGRRINISRDPSFQGLRWLFTWQSITKENGQTYDESGLASSMLQASSLESKTAQLSLFTNDHLAALDESYAEIESAPRGTRTESLRKAIHAALDPLPISSRLADQPALEIAAKASFRPALAGRARAVNRLSLREIFMSDRLGPAGESLNLNYHLTLLRRFLLMDHGMFVTRLSHALFDPSLTSSERAEGNIRSGQTGLRLGSRANWPPASSELQLALAGILATSVAEDTFTPVTARPRSSADLPGNLSFSLRHMSDEEIDKCLEQSSLEALDFLRIAYTPPRPLDVVILPDTLAKYDQIFKLLLRLQRLLFVVNHAFQRHRCEVGTAERGVAARFAHAAHHLVSSFADHVLSYAIARPWAGLMSAVTSLEDAVRAECTAPMPTATAAKPSELPPPRITERHGIDYLRRAHDAALDAMLFACLLRKRHDRVRAILDDAFGLILRFAALGGDTPRNEGEGEEAKEDGDMAVEMQLLYARLARQVGLFVQVCRGLADHGEAAAASGRSGSGVGVGVGFFADAGGLDSLDGFETDGFAALVARLTANDFYSRPAPAPVPVPAL